VVVVIVAFENAFDANGSPSVLAGLKVTQMTSGVGNAGRTRMGSAVAVTMRADVCHCILAMEIDGHSAAGTVWGALR
jgi:hypothetical protein